MNSRSFATAAAAQPLAYPDTPGLALATQRLLFRVLLIGADTLAISLAFLAGYWVRFDLGVTVSPDVQPNPGYYPFIFALLLPVFIAAFGLFRLYDLREILGGILEYSRLFQACSAAAIVIVVASFAAPQFVMSRVWLISGWLISLLAVTLARFSCRRVAYALRQNGYLLSPAAIVGTNQEAAALAVDLGHWRSSGLRVLGFVATGGERVEEAHHLRPVLGPSDQIRQIISENNVEEMIVAITSLNRQQLLSLCADVSQLKGVYLRLSSGLYEILTTGMQVKKIGTVPLVTLNKARLEARQVWTKRIVEYAVVIPALLLLIPIFLILAIIIRLDSKGPILHRRKVLGAFGHPFDALKFRTMRVDGDAVLAADPELGRQLRECHKLRQDPRVTRVGRWLRRYSLDELPQLVNVLVGQMSLVGPRMITAEEADKYGSHKLNLLTVKPGITGLWQVSGRSDLSYEERVRLDMYYIRNYSVWLDLQILLVQTVPAVIRGHGAY